MKFPLSNKHDGGHPWRAEGADLASRRRVNVFYTLYMARSVGLVGIGIMLFDVFGLCIEEEESGMGARRRGSDIVADSRVPTYRSIR
jgi:hypothetical protein